MVGSHLAPARQLTSLRDWHSHFTVQLHVSACRSKAERQRRQSLPASSQMGGDIQRRDALVMGGAMLGGLLVNPLQVTKGTCTSMIMLAICVVTVLSTARSTKLSMRAGNLL